MGEPGGLPFMGLHRVGHDRSDFAAAAANTSVKCIILSKRCDVDGKTANCVLSRKTARSVIFLKILLYYSIPRFSYADLSLSNYRHLFPIATSFKLSKTQRAVPRSNS